MKHETHKFILHYKFDIKRWIHKNR